MKHFSPILLIAILFVACSHQPEPIEFGKDECAHCSMRIMHPKFGSEIVTKKGKVYKFDSIECLLAEYGEKIKDQAEMLYAPDFMKDKEFIDLRKAFILRSEQIKSPMALNLLAFKNRNAMLGIKNKYGGEEMSLRRAIEYVEDKWK